MKESQKGFIIFIIFVFAGIMMTMQYRSILVSERENNVFVLRNDVLQKQLDEERLQNSYLIKKIKENEAIFERYLKNYIENLNSPKLENLLIERDFAKIIAGMTDVKGEGIIITLNDAPARNGMNPNDLIIHDSDITQVLNELRAAGAQAISINDERIIATSKQICAGPTILINNNRYAVPYVIKAIGDSETLYNALSQSELIAILNIYDIQVEIEKMEEIKIYAYQLTEQRQNLLLSGLKVVEE